MIGSDECWNGKKFNMRKMLRSFFPPQFLHFDQMEPFSISYQSHINQIFSRICFAIFRFQWRSDGFIFIFISIHETAWYLFSILSNRNLREKNGFATYFCWINIWSSSEWWSWNVKYHNDEIWMMVRASKKVEGVKW